jgi:hypothetical protein
LGTPIRVWLPTKTRLKRGIRFWSTALILFNGFSRVPTVMDVPRYSTPDEINAVFFELNDTIEPNAKGVLEGFRRCPFGRAASAAGADRGGEVPHFEGTIRFGTAYAGRTEVFPTRQYSVVW